MHGLYIWHIQMSGISEWVQFHVPPNENQADLNVLFDSGFGLIEWKETVGPWRRYALYLDPL